MSEQNYCPCGSMKTVKHCCEPLIRGITMPESPEALMRSRYSAYVLQDYAYILDTYSSASQKKHTVEEIEQSGKGTIWLGLNVLSSFAMQSEGEVEFVAYYKINNECYQMHEHSYFVFESDRWKYDKGEILHKTGKLKLSRNQPCICGSGQKYKRCCLLR